MHWQKVIDGRLESDLLSPSRPFSTSPLRQERERVSKTQEEEKREKGKKEEQGSQVWASQTVFDAFLKILR